MTSNDDTTPGRDTPDTGERTGTARAHGTGWSDSGFDAQAAKATITHPEGLRRSLTDRKLAGVCGGLGRQLGIDPTIVRVVMVALTLAGGVGVPLYVILALVMPNEGSDSTSVTNAVGPHLPEQVRSGPGLAILIAVLVLILGGIVGGASNDGPWNNGAWPWPLIGVGLLVWWIHRRRQAAQVAQSGQPQAQASGASPAPMAPMARQVQVPIDPNDPGAPGAEFWSRPDPLGLYEAPPSVPTQSPQQPRTIVKTKRAPIMFALTTIMLAGLSIGTQSFLAAAGVAVPPVLFVAVPALIVGLGLLLAAKRGGSRLLVAAAVVLGLATAGATQADLPNNTLAQAHTKFGTERTFTPATLNDANALGTLPEGRNRIDLSNVTFANGTVNLDLSSTDGLVLIVVPANLDLDATVEVAPRGWGGLATDENWFQTGSGGKNSATIHQVDDGADGANANGPKLDIDVTVNRGLVVIERDAA